MDRLVRRPGGGAPESLTLVGLGPAGRDAVQFRPNPPRRRHTITTALTDFQEALGLDQTPYGFAFTDEEPTDATPADKAKFDEKHRPANWYCVIRRLLTARRKVAGSQPYFDAPPNRYEDVMNKLTTETSTSIVLVFSMRLPLRSANVGSSVVPDPKA